MHPRAALVFPVAVLGYSSQLCTVVGLHHQHSIKSSDVCWLCPPSFEACVHPSLNAWHADVHHHGFVCVLASIAAVVGSAAI